MLNGASFLERQTRRTPVVWLTEERSPTFRNMLARVGLLDQDNLHILFRHESHGMPWTDVVAEAVGKARDTGSGMLVIDTLSGWTRLPGDDENSAGAAMTAMEPVHEAAAALLGVILNRHDRKGGGPLGESGRGSSAYAGEVDILFQLQRATNPGNQSRRILKGTGRFDGIPEELVIEFRDGRYAYLGDSSNVERRGAKAWLLEHLPNSDGTPLTKADIRERIGQDVSNSTIDRALREMVEESTADRKNGFGGNRQALGYWLTGNRDGDHDPYNLTTNVSTPDEVDNPLHDLDSMKPTSPPPTPLMRTCQTWYRPTQTV